MRVRPERTESVLLTLRDSFGLVKWKTHPLHYFLCVGMRRAHRKPVVTSQNLTQPSLGSCEGLTEKCGCGAHGMKPTYSGQR
ncbi:hypothetical protein NDU88_001061 [Pleurodeles waltl]|uniref:Uncharacterized protein n=1 Tax=Pleurodeles waltl TaxID=8319 RepID=A0AAV7N9Q9_PLEWA|nr:hypothetical protein NDU88_001061 [Pleurodeles waltl]